MDTGRKLCYWQLLPATFRTKFQTVRRYRGQMAGFELDMLTSWRYDFSMLCAFLVRLFDQAC